MSDEKSELVFGVTSNNKLGMQLTFGNNNDEVYQKEFSDEELEILRKYIENAADKKGNFYVLETKVSVTRHEFINPLTEEELEWFDTGEYTRSELAGMITDKPKVITDLISFDIIKVDDDTCVTGVEE